ncbi:hypothetical protein GO491_01055 [Flavobacteriaceae bacterium Ap0902]|nr:hypothetical protein [Flavobacteriaceae bacterium Ap0902]
MKKLLYILLLGSSYSLFAQVGVGIGAIPSNDYVSLELGTNAPAENLGLILPWITNESSATNAPVGTLVFDASTQKVKLSSSSTPNTPSDTNSIQSMWIDLSNNADTPNVAFSNPTNFADSPNACVIIGAETSDVEGILILETPDADNNPKAMVLPRVNEFSDIINPTAGMIVYVKKNSRLAVFNGAEWSFWEGVN